MSTESLKRSYHRILTATFFCVSLLPSFSIRKQIGFFFIKKCIHKSQKERAGSPVTVSLHWKDPVHHRNVPNPTQTDATSSMVQLFLEMRGLCPDI